MNQYIKNYVAEGAIAAYRIVMHGAADGQVLQATAATDLLIGAAVIPANQSVVANERVDVALDRFVPVEYGGTIAAGDPLTADASGKAVAAGPAAGTNNRIIGYAGVAGVAGDIVDVYIRPGQIQG